MSALPRHVCGVLIRRPRGYPQTQLRDVEFGFGESRFCISDFVTRSGDTRFRDSMSARRVRRPVFRYGQTYHAGCSLRDKFDFA